MANREPIWQDVVGILVAVLFLLTPLTRGDTFGYLPGDFRATPEFRLILTVFQVGSGIFLGIVFTIRLIGGLRGRRR